jgi:gas vesicle protein
MNPSQQKSSSPSWQSTVVAIVVLLMAGGIFVAVFEKSGTDDALQVWAALGTLVGAVIGAMPAYFFGQQGAAAAREEAQRTHEKAATEIQRWQGSQERAQETADAALQAKQQTAEESQQLEAREQAKAKAAEGRATEAEAKLQTLLAVGDKELQKTAKKQRPDLSW